MGRTSFVKKYTSGPGESQCGKNWAYFVTGENKRFQKMFLKCWKTGKEWEDSMEMTGVKMSIEKKSNKNVIKMKKGVAICKQLCYNSGTYIREKE